MKTHGLALALLVWFHIPHLRADSYAYQFHGGWNLVTHQIDRGSNTMNNIFPAGTGSHHESDAFLNATFWMPRISPIYPNPTNPILPVVFNYGEQWETSDWNSPNYWGNRLGTALVANNNDELGAGWYCPDCPWFPGDGMLAQVSWPVNWTFQGTSRPLSGRIVRIPAGGAFLLGAETTTNANYETVIGASPVEGTRVYRFNTSNLDPAPNPFHFAPPDYTVYTFSDGAWSPSPPILNIGEAAWFRAPPPTLNIQASNNNVILSWPTNSIPFTLESTTQAGPTSIWSTVGSPIVTNNVLQTVTLPLSTAESRFFRLRH